jgi:Undecaprenyl-phosphate glucose phosphotransferase
MNHQDPKALGQQVLAMAAAEAHSLVGGPPAAPEQRVSLSPQARSVAAELSARPVSATLLGGFLRIIDFLCLAAAGLGVYLFYVEPEAGIEWAYGIPLIAGSLGAVVLLYAADSYAVHLLRSRAGQAGRVLGVWTLIFAAFALAVFFLKLGELYSRVWLASWYAAGLLYFAVSRSVVAGLVGSWIASGRLERRAVIVGGGKNAEELLNALARDGDSDIRICGIFDDRSDDRSPAMVAGYPKLGTVAELVEFCRVARIDMLIVSLPITAETRLLQLFRQLWVLPVDIRLSAHTNKLRFRPRNYSYVGTVPFLDIADKPIADWRSVQKRAFDLVVAALLLVLFSPLLLATAIAIKLDSPGPVLFRQKRYGFNNEIINVLKFRSMYVDRADADAVKLVTKNDSRVTRVGRFIRKTSIDELPQLVNVLRGNLSLVGPRPHALQAKAANRLYQDVVDGYYARHRVKPGVTGWAQINGWRGETDTPEKIRKRVEFDLYYIENWSLLFDLYIVAMTPVRLLGSENAY